MYLNILKPFTDFNEELYRKPTCEIHSYTCCRNVLRTVLPHHWMLPILNSLRKFVLDFSARKKMSCWQTYISSFIIIAIWVIVDSSFPRHQPGKFEPNLMPNQINYVNNVNMFAFSSFVVLFSITILLPSLLHLHVKDNSSLFLFFLN